MTQPSLSTSAMAVHRNDLIPEGQGLVIDGDLYVHGLTLAALRTYLNAPVEGPVLRISFNEWKRWRRHG